jgi:hypothetical protein
MALNCPNEAQSDDSECDWVGIFHGMVRVIADFQGSEKVKFEPNFPFENSAKAWQLLITSGRLHAIGIKN